MSSSAAAPYIGAKISLVTNSDLRYEGILININTAQSTVTLRDVRMTGTERKGQFVMPVPEVYDFIVFNGKDIKDLTVSEPAAATFSVRQDPAVVAVNVAPAHIGYSNSPSHYEKQQSGYGAQAGGYGGGYNHNHNHGYNDFGGQHHGAYAHYNQGSYNQGGYQQNGAYHGGHGGQGGGYAQGGYAQSGYGPGGGAHANGGYRNGREQGQRLGGQYALGSKSAANRNAGVVGELSAQPNNNLKQQLADAYDFEQANTKFSAEERPELSVGVAYNKEQSFFDNISCEALTRKQGASARIDRDRQRELDTETFGPGATAALSSAAPRYPRRPFKRNGPANRAGHTGHPSYLSRPHFMPEQVGQY